MDGNYFTKQVVPQRKPLTGKQRAALLFSLLGEDGVEALLPHLSDRELQQLHKAMKSIQNQSDMDDDMEVLEALRRFGLAASIWPNISHSKPGFAKGYFEAQGTYQEPVASKRLESMGMNSEDIAKVLSIWLNNDE